MYMYTKGIITERKFYGFTDFYKVISDSGRRYCEYPTSSTKPAALRLVVQGYHRTPKSRFWVVHTT